MISLKEVENIHEVLSAAKGEIKFDQIRKWLINHLR